MTRKTKEEKKIADYRRRLKLLKQTTESENPDESRNLETHSEVKKNEETDNLTKDIQQQTYFNKDLKKSLLFIFLIITLEIVIYFARMNG